MRVAWLLLVPRVLLVAMVLLTSPAALTMGGILSRLGLHVHGMHALCVSMGFGSAGYTWEVATSRPA